MTEHLCKTCWDWWFKVETEKAWGLCMNEKVQAATYVSTARCQFPIAKTSAEYMAISNEISECAQIMFEENSFGCIHWTPRPWERWEHWYPKGYGLIQQGEYRGAALVFRHFDYDFWLVRCRDAKMHPSWFYSWSHWHWTDEEDV